jgi:hypothetical protein
MKPITYGYLKAAFWGVLGGRDNVFHTFRVKMI